jgi:tRNA-splicing ligase RtcB
MEHTESGNRRFFTDVANIELGAMLQIADTSAMPFVKALAVMPDVHLGKGSTVGTVIATQGAIIPAAVGVDIGCGMIAARLGLGVGDVRPHLKEIREGIERRIPSGIGPRGINSKLYPSSEARVRELEEFAGDALDSYTALGKEWRMAVGSLGGGNHFIELCEDEVGSVWVTLHSGSRGVGNKIGTSYIKRAQAMNERYFINLANRDLAYFVQEDWVFGEYVNAVKWAQKFAALNRDEMFDRVLAEFSSRFSGVVVESRINCHHNFVQMEHVGGFGNCWVTRKGAVSARRGETALIPGSMGTHSYVVEGLGCERALNSAPHGAGRRMSRGAARKEFTLEGLRKTMAEAGVECRVRDSIVDESPQAYKDIDVIISESRELVKVWNKLKPIMNIKGE